MRVLRQRLPPGVQDGDAANLGAEPMRIGGERDHGLGGGFEQDRINDGLVLKGDRGDRRRQREDDSNVDAYLESFTNINRLDLCPTPPAPRSIANLDPAELPAVSMARSSQIRSFPSKTLCEAKTNFPVRICRISHLKLWIIRLSRVFLVATRSVAAIQPRRNGMDSRSLKTCSGTMVAQKKSG